jgi:hypothetical protein
VKILHCRCESCRRHTASPLATFVCVPQERFRWLAGTPVAADTLPRHARGKSSGDPPVRRGPHVTGRS